VCGVLFFTLAFGACVQLEVVLGCAGHDVAWTLCFLEHDSTIHRGACRINTFFSSSAVDCVER
jgi:hypothetical protein